MTIEKMKEGRKLTLALDGRLDTTTAPQLEAEVTELVLDFSRLEYLSSAGLRVILAAQKIMNRQGKLLICHVNATILEIFEVTGFCDIFTVQ